uniref:RING-type E3 ubiquitin transferase n=1 Tax=Neogobius melanostomus TaxID=47308 RepID=A0A8C6SYV4_9GOBI
MVDFSRSFEDTEANRSRSEEAATRTWGNTGVRARMGAPRRTTTTTTTITTTTAAAAASPPASTAASRPPLSRGGLHRRGAAGEQRRGQRQLEPRSARGRRRSRTPAWEDTGGRTPHRTFSERLPGNRHSSARSVGARSARVRSAHPRPVSEAWIGLYRVNNRHGNIRCPFCSKPFPGGRIEEHLLSCLTSPPCPTTVSNNLPTAVKLYALTFLKQYPPPGRGRSRSQQ